MPTNRKAKKILMKALPPQIEGKIFELGAGFGTLAIPLAKRYPYQDVLAYEISPLPFLFLKAAKCLLLLDNLKVIRKDFYQVSFFEAGLCVCYLYPSGMERLEEKFRTELRCGSTIVSNTFALTGWKHEELWEVPDLYHTKIFLYRKHS